MSKNQAREDVVAAAIAWANLDEQRGKLCTYVLTTVSGAVVAQGDGGCFIAHPKYVALETASDVVNGTRTFINRKSIDRVEVVGYFPWAKTTREQTQWTTSNDEIV